MSDYEAIIGIEVHVELATASKMFCACPADHFGKEPNIQTCPVCLGLPGALPVPNRKAVERTILLGLALGCTINEESKFDRKHYFYPDLPKGYQISQYDMPFCVNGRLVIARSESSSDAAISKKQEIASPSERSRNDKVIRIRRVHLEEDTGKLMHATVNGERVSLVDFNRSGVPLVEIVTEPDFRSVEEVDVFVKKLQQIVRYLGISGADMEKGSMRIEPSVSLRGASLRATRQSQTKTEIASPSERSRNDNSAILPAYRVEIKNINSFKFARRAIEYEIERQKEQLEQGLQPTQQTRGFVESKGITVAQREKEEAHDYRYFPEPDIPPVRWTGDQISNIKNQIGELPDIKKARFMKKHGLNEYDATQLAETRERGEFFEENIKYQISNIKYKAITPKMIANWMINKKVDIAALSPEKLLDQIVRSMAVASVSDDELERIIKQVLAENSKAVEDYKNGKTAVIGFLIGIVVRKLPEIDKQLVQTALRQMLGGERHE